MPPNHQTWCETLHCRLLFVQSQAAFGVLANTTLPKPPKVIYPEETTMKAYLEELQFPCPSGLSPELYNAHLSELATYPLTLLHALQLLSRQGATNPTEYEHLVVHVVGAEESFECSQMRKWKYFFINLLPKLKTLHLVFIGCELSIHDEKVHVDGRLVFEYHARMTYADYCRKCYIKPSIVCAFNCGLYRNTGFQGVDSWGPSIVPMLGKAPGVPLLLSAYTSREANLDVQRVWELLGTSLHVIQQPMKNPFASIFPNHNLVSESECPVAFRNFFMSIVKQS